MDQRYRVVVAKTGLDGHDRGLRVIAWVLRAASVKVGVNPPRPAS